MDTPSTNGSSHYREQRVVYHPGASPTLKFSSVPPLPLKSRSAAIGVSLTARKRARTSGPRNDSRAH